LGYANEFKGIMLEEDKMVIVVSTDWVVPCENALYIPSFDPLLLL
jgi:hypothetical protein